jgi:hypothetical protein
LAIVLLFSLSDVRMIMRGGVSGAKRIARHVVIALGDHTDAAIRKAA